MGRNAPSYGPGAFGPRASLACSPKRGFTDFEWSIIEPLLPNKPRGVPRAEDRRVQKGEARRHVSGEKPDER